MSKFWSSVFYLVLMGVSCEVYGADNILSICNHNSDRSISASYMLQAGGGAGWQSQGWYNAASGQCFDINLGSYVGAIYLYAEDQYQQTNWGEGTVQFCVNRTIAFEINNADTVDCSDPKLKKVHSDQMTIVAGTNIWNVEPNFSQLNLCNHNLSLPMFVALADPASGTFTSSGWYQVAAGKCELVMVGKYTGPVSYYAEDSQSDTWTGTAPAFCVNKTSAFTIPNADQATLCTDTTLKMVSPRSLAVQLGENTVDFEALQTGTILKLCNNIPDKTLMASYAIAGTGSLWQSTGWLQIDPQKCSSVDLGSYVGKSYIYAEWNLGQSYWGSGPFNYCVNRTQNFTIADSTNLAQCNSDINQKMVPAYEFDIQSGTYTFNFNP